MNNKIVVSLALLFLCKTLALIAGSRQSKAQARIQGSRADTGVEIDKMPLLFMAIRKSNMDAIQRLIRQGVNLEARFSTGRSPLEHAVAHNAVDVISLLLSHEVRIEKPVILAAIDAVNQENLSRNTLCSIVKKSKGQNLGKPLQELFATAVQGPKRKDLFLSVLETVEDNERATVAEVILMSRRIFPHQSVINGTILSYVSSYKETLEERAHTLAHLPNQY